MRACVCGWVGVLIFYKRMCVAQHVESGTYRRMNMGLVLLTVVVFFD